MLLTPEIGWHSLTKLVPGRKPKATPPKDTPATAPEKIPASPLENLDPAFWTAKLDTQKKENTEFKDIKILLFFDQSTPDPHVFQSPGLELIIYQHMVGFPMFNPRGPAIFGLLCDHASSERHCLLRHKGLH
jgi:hypothetical protein